MHIAIEAHPEHGPQSTGIAAQKQLPGRGPGRRVAPPERRPLQPHHLRTADLVGLFRFNFLPFIDGFTGFYWVLLGFIAIVFDGRCYLRLLQKPVFFFCKTW